MLESNSDRTIFTIAAIAIGALILGVATFIFGGKNFQNKVNSMFDGFWGNVDTAPKSGN
jgi:uncharacterized membrane protein